MTGKIFIPNYMKLIFIAGKKEICSSDCTRMLNMTQTNISNIVKGLIVNKLIELKKIDGKKKNIILTESGKQLYLGVTFIFDALKVSDDEIYNKYYLQSKSLNSTNTRNI